MRKNMKAVLLLRSGEIYTCGLIMAIAGIVALVTGLLTSSTNLEIKEGLYLFGMTFVVYPFINLFLRILFLVDETSKGLSFGMTRRVFFIISRIYDLIEITLITLIMILIFGSDYTILIVIGAVLYFGLMMWIEGLVGNNVIKFGKIVYIIYYVSLLVLLIGGPKLLFFAGFEDDMESIGNNISAINGSPTMFLVATGLFILLGVGCNWLTFRKIPINTNF